MLRPLYALFGMGFLGVGFVGAFVPILPTTIFVILAWWCFARSSPRLDAWLRRHPLLGPPLVSWIEHGVIRRKAKVLASVGIVVAAVLTVVNVEYLWASGLLVGGFGGLLWYIWTRPEASPEGEPALRTNPSVESDS